MKDQFEVRAPRPVGERHIPSGRTVETGIIAAFELAEKRLLPSIVDRIVLSRHSRGDRIVGKGFFEPLPPSIGLLHQLAGIGVGELKRHIQIRILDVEDLRRVGGPAGVGEIDHAGNLLANGISRGIPCRDEVGPVEGNRIDDV